MDVMACGEDARPCCEQCEPPLERSSSVASLGRSSDIELPATGCALRGGGLRLGAFAVEVPASHRITGDVCEVCKLPGKDAGADTRLKTWVVLRGDNKIRPSCAGVGGEGSVAFAAAGAAEDDNCFAACAATEDNCVAACAF